MPRSGTSLLEQILSNHSKISGAGELTKISELKSKLITTRKELTSENSIRTYYNENLIKKIKDEILSKDLSVKGFNVGTNSGVIAGQSIMHCHIHLIPRREGDVDNPQGGVRSVIPLKQHYKRKV